MSSGPQHQGGEASAMITGGASGLGAAVARRLAADGYRVAIVDRDGERAEALAGELGAGAVALRADVTVAAEVDEAAARAAEAAPLRVVCACAGIAPFEKLAGSRGPHDPGSFAAAIAVNLIGTFHAIRSGAEAMSANSPNELGDRGVCLMTASIAAYEGQIGQIAYAASKGGVAAMTLPAARDLSSLAIRVCTIAPGIFDTPMLAGLPENARKSLGESVPFPQRLGRPDEYASLVSAVISNQMLNGEVIRLDGALRMAPR